MKTKVKQAETERQKALRDLEAVTLHLRMVENQLFRDMAQLAQAREDVVDAQVRYEGDRHLPDPKPPQEEPEDRRAPLQQQQQP